MRKFYALIGAIVAMFVMWMVLGAAAPAPLYRNQWSTNFPGAFVQGDVGFTNLAAANGWITIKTDGLRAFNKGGLEIVHLYTDNNLSAADFGAGFASIFTNGAAAFTMKDSTQVGVLISGAAGQSADLLRVGNSGGGVVAAIHPAGSIYSSTLSSNLALYTDVNTNLVSAGVSNLVWASTVDINFNVGPYQYLIVTNDTTFTGSRLGAAKAVAIKIFAGATNYNLTFPAWTFIGNTAPATIASNKTAVLSLTCFDSNTTNIVAAYAVQP
jgi:hypothetical protein